MSKYKKLEAKYNKLSSSEQDCLKIFTLAIDTVDLRGGTTILRTCNIDTLNGEALTQKVFQRVVQPLIESQFLIENTRTKFSINPKVHRFCFKKILEEAHLDEFIEAIRTQYPVDGSGYYDKREYRTYEVGLREMQFALAAKDGEAFQMHMKKVKKSFPYEPTPIQFFFVNPLEKEFLALLSIDTQVEICLLYTSPSPRDATLSRMPSSA